MMLLCRAPTLSLSAMLLPVAMPVPLISRRR